MSNQIFRTCFNDENEDCPKKAVLDVVDWQRKLYQDEQDGLIRVVALGWNVAWIEPIRPVEYNFDVNASSKQEEHA